jgi:hypothetical protein
VTTSPKRLALIGMVAAILLVAVIAFATTRPSTGSSASSSDQTGTSSATDPGSRTGADDPASTVAPVDSSTAASEPVASPPRTAPPVPLDVQVSSTDRMVDGQEVRIHISPQSGFSAYGAEAFLCKADATYLLDADIRPTQTGKCISTTLSVGSNDYVKVAAAPPYAGFDLAFKVGVGTDTYTMSNGQPVSVTCGPGHPCQLVLKLQFTNAFGFQAYPVTYR